MGGGDLHGAGPDVRPRGPEGRRRRGADADLVVYDPNAKHTISAKTHHMDVDYSCYEGREVTGQAEIVLSRGKVIVDGDEWLGAAGRRPVPEARAHRRGAGPDLIRPLDCSRRAICPPEVAPRESTSHPRHAAGHRSSRRAGQQESSEPDASLTLEATPEANVRADEPEPSDEPAASEDDGGATGALADVIPDDLNGVAGTPSPGHGPDHGGGAPGAGPGCGRRRVRVRDLRLGEPMRPS